MDLRDRLLREAEAWRSDHMQQQCKAKAEQHSGFNVSEAMRDRACLKEIGKKHFTRRLSDRCKEEGFQETIYRPAESGKKVKTCHTSWPQAVAQLMQPALSSKRKDTVQILTCRIHCVHSIGVAHLGFAWRNLLQLVFSGCDSD
eukprot:847368-Amphidinium_carterae.1